MDKRNLAFGKSNFVLLAIGVLVVIIGFIMMSGGSSTENMYDPSIFNAQRIKVAPVVCLIGFLSIIYAILHKSKDSNDNIDS
ncbi:hypothetical protein HMPREF3034_01896 [Prevotella sp. DNF00663]|uniref:DUF3098 domain-containing protein n=1 Tax=unclassified Prevotella TaxID=2638335 RepID=UPI000513F3AF|nr:MULTISPECIES: DUF3098 domain-containing protein [unclassified Prevotella]KGI59701.1 membrane protein [Prevotella sp. S7 MS 2]KXB81340.1 hypothetical protein HMPREF3034_01896 [Prevotella sp. DNF00663]